MTYIIKRRRRRRRLRSMAGCTYLLEGVSERESMASSIVESAWPDTRPADRPESCLAPNAAAAAVVVE